MFCELYYVPFYLASVKNYEPTIIGVYLMPMTGTMIPASVIVGRLMTRFGRYRWAVWLGWAVTIMSTGLLIVLDAHIRTYAWILIFLAVGLGHGLTLTSMNLSIQAMANTHNVAYAAAMYTFARTFGMCIGVAIGGTVFQNELARNLGILHLSIAIADDAEGFVTHIKTLPKDSAPYQEYIIAYAESFKVVFEVLTGVAALAGLLSLLIKECTMNKDLGSEHVLGQEKQTVKPEALPAAGMVVSKVVPSGHKPPVGHAMELTLHVSPAHPNSRRRPTVQHPPDTLTGTCDIQLDNGPVDADNQSTQRA